MEQPDLDSVEEHITSVLDQHFFSVNERVRALEETVAGLEKDLKDLNLKVVKNG